MNLNLVELRKQAEQAVKDMPEGDLKLKAFETFLTHLLSQDVDKSAVGGGRKPHSKQKETKGRQGAEKDPKTATDRILFLKEEGFFDSQKGISEVRVGLKK